MPDGSAIAAAAEWLHRENCNGTCSLAEGEARCDGKPYPHEIERAAGLVAAIAPHLISPFPFPLADPVRPPQMVIAPCGCTSMDTGQAFQVSWCEAHDPGYESGRADG